jgi:hypothetical protein
VPRTTGPMGCRRVAAPAAPHADLTIVLPGADAVVPGLEIQTPERTIKLEIDGTPRTIDFMDPAL